VMGHASNPFSFSNLIIHQSKVNHRMRFKKGVQCIKALHSIADYV
jgi:hypothetical protein